jgi:putative two-component system response regulator
LRTIFIVDDSDTNLATAEGALEDYYRVITLPSAAKMFSFLEKMTPDLILLDIEMPVMNGFEALESLKANNSWADIPVIFLTGTVNASIEKRSSDLGADGIIIKPFSPSGLLERVKSRVTFENEE